MAATEGLYIAISGLIGAGKTTLASALAKELNVPVFFEPVETNEYLADFYRDTSKYAFAMQIYLLNSRYQQQQKLVWGGRGGIQDRSIYEDSIFAEMLWRGGHMSERDFQTYQRLLVNMHNMMKRPNFIIHLDVTPEESLDRIRKRGRECEKTITLEYLEALHATYERHLSEISRIIPVFRVPWHKFGDPEEISKLVVNEYRRTFNIHTIGNE